MILRSQRDNYDTQDEIDYEELPASTSDLRTEPLEHPDLTLYTDWCCYRGEKGNGKGKNYTASLRSGARDCGSHQSTTTLRREKSEEQLEEKIRAVLMPREVAVMNTPYCVFTRWKYAPPSMQFSIQFSLYSTLLQHFTFQCALCSKEQTLAI